MKKIFNADNSELPAIHAYVRQVLAESGVDAELTFDALVVAEELTTNICQYAYADHASADHPIEIDLQVIDRNRMMMKFTDYGVAFDPLAYRKPEGASRNDIGGLGLMLVKRLAHNLEYKRYHCKNITTVTIVSDDALQNDLK